MKQYQILLLEDCIPLQLYYQQSIESYFLDKVKVSVGSTGQEGLIAIISHHFDCVITDNQMPVLNGIEFIQRAREIYKFTKPILLHTGGNIPELDDALISYSPLFLEKKQNKLDYIYDYIDRCIG